MSLTRVRFDRYTPYDVEKIPYAKELSDAFDTAVQFAKETDLLRSAGVRPPRRPDYFGAYEPTKTKFPISALFADFEARGEQRVQTLSISSWFMKGEFSADVNCRQAFYRSMNRSVRVSVNIEVPISASDLPTSRIRISRTDRNKYEAFVLAFRGDRVRRVMGQPSGIFGDLPESKYISRTLPFDLARHIVAGLFDHKNDARANIRQIIEFINQHPRAER